MLRPGDRDTEKCRKERDMAGEWGRERQGEIGWGGEKDGVGESHEEGTAGVWGEIRETGEGGKAEG